VFTPETAILLQSIIRGPPTTDDASFAPRKTHKRSSRDDGVRLNVQPADVDYPSYSSRICDVCGPQTHKKYCQIASGNTERNRTHEFVDYMDIALVENEISAPEK
jgi:hypothetical protein